MRAIIYGAGKIGRGFIGAMLRRSGYDVVLIDIAQSLVAQLNERHGYPIRIMDPDGREDQYVEGVSAIDGTDMNAVADAIATCDLLTSSVGVNALKDIAPLIAEGIRRRCAITDATLDILICENLVDSGSIMKGLIQSHMTPAEREKMDRQIGVVEASIGVTVPLQTPEMLDGDPLRLCVERYGHLPVDSAAFVGQPPKIDGLQPFSPFGFYLKRKLYIHNMAHALCAYLGMVRGLAFVWQAAIDPDIALIARCAMQESLRGLCAEYQGADPVALLDYIDDLLWRFTNRALADTCPRVGFDVPRKLSPNDRLMGAANLCKKHAIAPAHIAIGAAAAVYKYLDEQRLAQSEANAAQALTDLAQPEKDGCLMRLILDQHALIAQGAPLSALRESAQRVKAVH